MIARTQAFHPQKIVDQFLAYCRYRRVYQLLQRQHGRGIIYDLGCGTGRLVHALRQRGYQAFGIDRVAGEHIIAADLNGALPVDSDSVDLVISLANVEHLDNPSMNLKEIHRILRPTGTLVLTTPSTAAKPVLEYLAFRLQWIDPAEILDHKTYFSKKRLAQYLCDAGFGHYVISRFQCGMNLHAVATK